MKRLRDLFRRIRRRLVPSSERRTPSENALIMLIPVVGVVVGLASLGIAHLISLVQALLWGDGHDLLGAAKDAPLWLRIAAPASGGLVIGLLGVLLKVRMQGHGTAGLVHALALKNGVVSLRKEYPGTVTGILTVGCGGSLGREGPMAEFGVAVSSWLGRRFRLEPQHLRILVCAAAAAGIAAAYNAPIGASIFALEVLIGSLALEVFGPVVVASVIATLISRFAMGSLPRFVVPEYELVSVWELGGYAVLGVLGGIFAVGVIRGTTLCEDGFARLKIPAALKPALGFGLVGVMGIWWPYVYGNGYEATNLALHEAMPLGLLLLLPFAKLVATALTRGSGGAGGMFTPTLMMGALLGSSFGMLVNHWFPEHTASPGAYALVGMAAVLSGTTHAPITAIMMIFEQTDSYQIILPLMFVSIVSHATARALKRESLQVESLRRRGIELPRGPEDGVMQSLRVSNVMHRDVEAVKVSDGFQTIVEAFLRNRWNYTYVIDGSGALVGAIALHEIKEMLREADALDMVIAHDLVDPEFRYVTPDDTLAATIDLFWQQNSERLPVVEDRQSRRLVGWISKRDLMGVYRQEILGEGQLLSRFGRRDDREGRQDRYVELPEGFEVASVSVPPDVVGKSLRELDPRRTWGFYVLQITRLDPARGTRVVEMPAPDSVLQADDQLVVVGPTEGIANFR
jgi:chloride channel protein, CIC family